MLSFSLRLQHRDTALKTITDNPQRPPASHTLLNQWFPLSPFQIQFVKSVRGSSWYFHSVSREKHTIFLRLPPSSHSPFCVVLTCAAPPVRVLPCVSPGRLFSYNIHHDLIGSSQQSCTGSWYPHLCLLHRLHLLTPDDPISYFISTFGCW